MLHGQLQTRKQQRFPYIHGFYRGSLRVRQTYRGGGSKDFKPIQSAPSRPSDGNYRKNQRGKTRYHLLAGRQRHKIQQEHDGEGHQTATRASRRYRHGDEKEHAQTGNLQWRHSRLGAHHEKTKRQAHEQHHGQIVGVPQCATQQGYTAPLRTAYDEGEDFDEDRGRRQGVHEFAALLHSLYRGGDDDKGEKRDHPKIPEHSDAAAAPYAEWDTDTQPEGKGNQADADFREYGT